MRAAIREHVLLVTIGLTIVSAVLVFAATLELVPDAVLPVAPGWVFDVIPHLNAVFAVLALGVMARGFMAIRSGDIDTHRRSMLIAFGAFIAFLVLYLYNVSIMGPAEFPGPDLIRYYVYLPVLVVHIGLAVVCLPLLYYVMLLATTRPISEIPQTKHAMVARPALLLWAISFLLGLVIYLQLHLIY